jgi:hypothetical protein
MKSEPEQLAMFKRIAAGDHRPNEHGLFDIHQVAHLVTKRGCRLHSFDDYGCEIRYPGKFVSKFATSAIMATDRGLWSPVNVFRACREAVGQPHYEIDYKVAKIRNLNNLDEIRIAEIIGSDGVRPYLSRPGQYEVEHKENGQFAQYHNPLHAADIAFREIFVAMGNTKPKAAAGDYTWPMFCVMHRTIEGSGKSYEYRRAVRALDDAGLLKLAVGPRGGFGTATFRWLQLAFLQPIERPAPKLDPVDAEYLADLAARG